MSELVDARLAWAAEHCRVPILASATAAGAGAPASLIDNLGSPEGVITLIGTSLRALHDSSLDGSTLDGTEQEELNGTDHEETALFSDGWQALHDLIQSRLERGEIVSEDLPDPYCRYEPARLVEMWIEGRPDMGDDSPVLCHGDPTLDNTIVDRAELVGFVGAASMSVADRHLDLAIVHHSLQSTIGGEAAFIFYDAYGVDPNMVRLDHYLFAALLRA